ncbi:hypothetical protein [Chitinophaga sp. LS1]|uniref:hypothetical protein n=1 Tax=Chitinophaga sp. LS1 TaxID=3051176 RepID=UPI002AABE8FB|nr:hypothetical protein [Chitinophaga sp. LS1]WPV70576.1 hypothetical protein QQL36_17850 [Chitinophaga sp. LS1]
MKEATKYSKNFLNDLSISLEQSAAIYKSAICKALKYGEADLLYMTKINMVNEKGNAEFFSGKVVSLILRTYNQLIGIEHMSSRAEGWKTRLRGFYKDPRHDIQSPYSYSMNIMDDLIRGLVDSPLQFKQNVCEKLKWEEKVFDYKRMVPVANDYDTYAAFNKKQIGLIIPIYQKLIAVDQVCNRAIKWKIKLNS